MVADANPKPNELDRRMRASKTEFIQITISEPWLRAYQVLVGRTHPEMNGTHHGGFIFSAIKVISSCS
jgi:tRNA (adenine-N(1)-)-methyltransferase non-catalytic subunit